MNDTTGWVVIFHVWLDNVRLAHRSVGYLSPRVGDSIYLTPEEPNVAIDMVNYDPGNKQVRVYGGQLRTRSLQQHDNMIAALTLAGWVNG